jgi:glycosyltransferase involved in cell wall biosynthesis
VTGSPRALRVAVVVHSLEDNNIGRVFPFLRAFDDGALVRYRLVGWRRGRGLFPLLHDDVPPIVALRGSHVGARAERGLRAALAGCDLVHCFKPRPHFITASNVAEDLGIPLLLDVDDWEAAIDSAAGTLRSRVLNAVQHLRNANAAALERLARTGVAGVTVNSTALQSRYGGTLLYTAADPRDFDVDPLRGRDFRRRHAIAPERKVIGFLGTPHSYKGFDDLLEAFEILRSADPEVHLLVAGVPRHNPYRRRLQAVQGATTLGYLPTSEYPDAYGACDVIAIPQRAVGNGSFQTPAKLIFAMASSRAIVATPVGDIAAILGDAGVFVAPEAPNDLAETLGTILSDPRLRRRLGAAARERFVAGFSLERLRAETFAIYQEALRRVERRPGGAA